MHLLDMKSTAQHHWQKICVVQIFAPSHLWQMVKTVEDRGRHPISSLFVLAIEFTRNSTNVLAFRCSFSTLFIFPLHLEIGNLLCAFIVFVVRLRRFHLCSSYCCSLRLIILFIQTILLVVWFA